MERRLLGDLVGADFLVDATLGGVSGGRVPLVGGIGGSGSGGSFLSGEEDGGHEALFGVDRGVDGIDGNGGVEGVVLVGLGRVGGTREGRTGLLGRQGVGAVATEDFPPGEEQKRRKELNCGQKIKLIKY